MKNEKTEFDYDFSECFYILSSAFMSEFKEVNNKILLEANEAILYNFITKDEDIISILMQKNKCVSELIDEVLELNFKRLMSKEAFHRFIEKNHHNVKYEDYPLLYKEYSYLIKELRDNTKENLLNYVVMDIKEELKRIKKDKIIIKFSDLQVKQHERKTKISELFENSLNEVRNTYDKRVKKDERDYSQLNFLDDLRVLWVESIREKTAQDAITKNFKDDTLLQKNKNGKYHIKNLQLYIVAIARARENNSLDKNFIIIVDLMLVFNDIGIVKSLCVKGYKEVKPLMSHATFKSKIENKKIQHLIKLSHSHST